MDKEEEQKAADDAWSAAVDRQIQALQNLKTARGTKEEELAIRDYEAALRDQAVAFDKRETSND